jgi:hypothetical protein
MKNAPYSEPLLRIRDNPLLHAQARRRTRPKPFFTMVALVGLFCIWTLWVAGTAEGNRYHFVVIACNGLIGFLFLLRATSNISATVVFDRTSGLLDFHRASPTTPLTDAVGYIVGSSAREYVGSGIAALTALYGMHQAGVPFGNALAGLFVLFLTGLTYQCFGLFTGLVFSKQRAAKGGAMGVVISLFILSSLFSAGALAPLYHLTPFPAFAELGIYGSQADKFSHPLHFFTIEIQPVLYTLIIQSLAICFTLWCACRKLARAEAVAVSRKAGLVFGGLLIFLALSSLWPLLSTLSAIGLSSAANAPEDIFVLNGTRGFLGLGVLLSGGILITAGFLIIAAPRPLHAARAWRRAKAKNRKRAFWLDDGGPVEELLLCHTAILWACVLAAFFEASNQKLTFLKHPDTLLLMLAIPLILALATYSTTASRIGASSNRGTFWVILLNIGPFLLVSGLGISGQMGWEKSQYILSLSPLTAIAGAPFCAIYSLIENQPNPSDIPEFDRAVVWCSVLVAGLLACAAIRLTRSKWKALEKTLG